MTDYDAIEVQIYKDHETFSSCTSVTGPFPGFPAPPGGRRHR